MLPATGQGVGLLQGGTNEQLVYTLWNGSSWSALAQLNADFTLGQPALATVGSTVHAVYLGTDNKLYYEAFTGGAWTTASAPVTPMGASGQVCGPSPGVLAPLAAGPSLVFVNGGTCGGATNHLYNTDLSSGGWSTSQDVAPQPSFSASLRPAVTAPLSGLELCTVFVLQGESQLASAYRTSGGTWISTANIQNGLTNDPVALAPLASGALLAYRGTDGMLYTATFSSAGAPSWSTPTAAFTPTNVSVAATPALIKGIGSATAEMVYVDGTGALMHTRLMGSAWSTPVAVAPGMTGFVHVAITGGP
jgi:hypothetical protein